MPEEQSRQLDRGDPEDDFQPPDLRPLRALAEREELADARARLADALGHPLPADDPNAPLAWDVAAALTEAGFTSHNCAPHQPQYRLGGVCVLPIPGRHNPDGQGGIAVFVDHPQPAHARLGPRPRTPRDPAGHEPGTRQRAQGTGLPGAEPRRGGPLRTRRTRASRGRR